MLHRKVAISLFVLLLSTTSALAQDATCSALIQQAISAVQDDCSATGRNQACYGNAMLEATPREGVQNFTFEQQGDLANVVDLDALRLSSLDPEAERWGVALMSLQANLPDTLPGQNVTFLLFGNVEIENAVPAGESQATIEITSGGSINVRSGPSTSAGIIGSLASDEMTTANGRIEDSSWLRIQLPDSDALGWVFAELVTADGEVSELSVVDAADTEMPFQPMQAFRYSTGIGTTACTGAPQDGILIQTPEGAGKITLRANDVDIALGSTAYLQAQPGSTMTISLLEGEGTATAEGVTVTIPQGTQVEIPIDEDLQAAGAPGDPVPYDASVMAVLPVQALPEEITIAPPATEEDIATSNQPPSDGVAPAMGGDFSAFGGMSPAIFCPIFNQALAEEGMTRDEYISGMTEVLPLIPADQQASIQQMLDLVRSCP